VVSTDSAEVTRPRGRTMTWRSAWRGQVYPRARSDRFIEDHDVEERLERTGLSEGAQ
jgi:hypothetical protein